MAAAAAPTQKKEEWISPDEPLRRLSPTHAHIAEVVSDWLRPEGGDRIADLPELVTEWIPQQKDDIMYENVRNHF